MISAATNDAVFEVITGESWNNQALLIFFRFWEYFTKWGKQ
jgi:hypothetical protein